MLVLQKFVVIFELDTEVVTIIHFEYSFWKPFYSINLSQLQFDGSLVDKFQIDQIYLTYLILTFWMLFSFHLLLTFSSFIF